MEFEIILLALKYSDIFKENKCDFFNQHKYKTNFNLKKGLDKSTIFIL